MITPVITIIKKIDLKRCLYYYNKNGYDYSYSLSYKEYYDLMDSYGYNALVEKDYNNYVALAQTYNYDEYYKYVSAQVYYGSSEAKGDSYVTYLLGKFSNLLSKSKESGSDYSEYYSNLAKSLYAKKQEVEGTLSTYRTYANYY